MFNFTRKPKYTFEDDEMDGFDTYTGDEEVDEVDEPVEAPVAPAEPVAPAPVFTPAPIALKIITPQDYKAAREITDYLMNGNTILINLDGIDRAVVVRILDYLSGAIQVVGGMMTKVGKTTIVVAPKNVDVSSIEAMVGNTAD